MNRVNGYNMIIIRMAVVFMMVLMVVCCNNVSVNAYSSKCRHGSCQRDTITGSRFCSFHTCQKGRTNCKREVTSINEKCSVCKNKAKNKNNSNSSNSRYSTGKNGGSSTSGKKSTSTKSKSSKKKVEMPDCDDYESFEDFMDDWDGCMPDGSDAEDYWEDW